jgi:hypothetical protein
MAMITARAVLATSIILPACSAPSFQKQVSEFSDVLSKTKASFETLAEEERRTFIATQTRLALQDDYVLGLSDKCRVGPSRVPLTKSVDCRPQLVSRIPGGKSVALDFRPAVPQALKLVSRIAEYGQGLVSLAEAKEISDLKDAVANASAAIVRLHTDVAGKDAAQPFGAIATFASWTIGKFLDEQRFEKLRDAVHYADPLIGDATELLASQTVRIQRSIIAQKSELLNRDQVELERLRLSAPKDRASIEKAADTFVANAIALQYFAETDVITPFRKMRDAHATLLDALDRPDIPIEIVFGQINEFLDQVDRLKKGIDQGNRGSK